MSAVIGAMIVHAAAAQGADPAALCASTGFDPSRAADPDARISLAVEEALWNEAARRTGDEAFGLHAALAIRPGAFDVLDYAVRCAPDLRAALERLVRYNRLVHDVATFALKESATRLRIEHGFRDASGVQSRHSADFTVGSLVTIGAQITGAPLVPRAVEFRHGRPSPAVVAEYARFFGLEPRFAQRSNALEIDADLQHRPLVAADPALSRVIERHAEALLAARPAREQSVADRVRRVLAASLGEGEATLALVADRLRMSERSVQRKLAEEGVTFDALLDELRRDLALRYLADPKLAIAEVAYLLGYSEPSPFHRAFKRWTGHTPAEARKRAA